MAKFSTYADPAASSVIVACSTDELGSRRDDFICGRVSGVIGEGRSAYGFEHVEKVHEEFICLVGSFRGEFHAC